MKKKNTRIIFDVTHLVGWKGNLTGIPRTTDEVARRLRHIEGSVFVSWSEVRGDFMKVDIDYYYEHVDKINRDYFKQKNIKVPENELSHSVKSRLKKNFPSQVEYAVRVKNKIVRSIPDYRQKTDLDLKLFSSSYSPKAGDNFFIPCGTWDNDAYIRKVLSYKQKRAKIIFLSYDLLPIVVPQFSGQWGEPMKNFMRRVVSVCDLVLSISEHTKKDLISWFKKEKLILPEVGVIHLGDSFTDTSTDVPVHKEFVRSKVREGKEKFILCTGTVEARKNHVLLYYVYKLAASKGISLPKLIIAGRPGHRTENIIDFIKDDPEVNEKIFILDDVNDGELAWLYDNCSFTIYPSFYEGWGLPIAESIVKGVPCICSNSSSMTEVAPGVPNYFNPCSPEECMNLIVKYDTNEGGEYDKAKKRAASYRPRSWDVTFNQIMKQIKTIQER